MASGSFYIWMQQYEMLAVCTYFAEWESVLVVVGGASVSGQTHTGEQRGSAVPTPTSPFPLLFGSLALAIIESTQ